MNTPIPRIGVATFVVNKNNEILLGVRINSHGHDTWSLPGGHLEFMEQIEDCSKREVCEETGLVIDDVEILNITNDFFEQDNKHYITIFTLARNFEGEPQVKEPEKCRCWEWKSIDRLPENLFQPLATFLKIYGLKL